MGGEDCPNQSINAAGKEMQQMMVSDTRLYVYMCTAKRGGGAGLMGGARRKGRGEAHAVERGSVALFFSLSFLY